MRYQVLLDRAWAYTNIAGQICRERDRRREYREKRRCSSRKGRERGGVNSYWVLRISVKGGQIQN